MSFSIIAAVAKNGVIGKNNTLPWTIPEDLEYFYKLVCGKPVIVGRKTCESLGKPIKSSVNYVVSHNRLLQLSGYTVICPISDILALYQNSVDEVMVIGGASIYEQFLPFVDKMYLTFIDSNISGDSYFPLWQKEEWIVIDKRDSKFGIYSYSFVVLQRKIALA